MNTPTIEQRLNLRSEPNQTVAMYQDWRDLLFLHWEYDPAYIQRTLPQGLFVDTFEDKAYIGLTPFFVKNLRIPNIPAIPGVSDFKETNVRTYVYDQFGNPGVWFYSLDADQWLAVQAAKLLNLPYIHSSIISSINNVGVINYNVGRKDNIVSHFNYKLTNQIGEAKPESLDFFLIERYLMFYLFNKNLYKIRVHHQPYPLFETELISFDPNLIRGNGLQAKYENPNHVISSSGVDTKIYVPEKVFS